MTDTTDTWYSLQFSQEQRGRRQEPPAMSTPDTYPAVCLACGADMKQRPCAECKGTGTQEGERCDNCNGHGWVWFCPKEPSHPERRNI